jgi:hypothetical protein
MGIFAASREVAGSIAPLPANAKALRCNNRRGSA